MRFSKKIVLATFGTLGDVYPFIAIAVALEQRGFDPVIVAPAMHRAAIEAEGISYAQLRPHQQDIMDALGLDLRGTYEMMLNNPHFILDEIYLRFLRETYEDVISASTGALVVLTHSLLVGAAQAAEKLMLPTARIALAPLHLQSAMSPSLTPGAPYCLAPRNLAAISYNRLVRRVVRMVTQARMGRLRSFRSQVDLPATHEDFFLDFGRSNTVDAIFGLYSSHFAPRESDQPKNLTVTGFPFYRPRDPARANLDPALEAFLAAGEPPIVFTLGSFAPDVSDDFYAVSLDAVRRLGRRAVLLTGAHDDGRLASNATKNEYVCASAPHARLFPRSLAIVHHGGIGTTAEAIRAGKPQLVVPFFGDQPDHGARIQRLGVGTSMTVAAYTVEGAATALRKLLSSGKMTIAAQKLALDVSQDPGVDAVADWVVAIISDVAAIDLRQDRAGQDGTRARAKSP